MIYPTLETETSVVVALRAHICDQQNCYLSHDADPTATALRKIAEAVVALRELPGDYARTNALVLGVVYLALQEQPDGT